MTQKVQNYQLYQSLMTNDSLSEADKNYFRREKKEFDEGFQEASEEVYLQQCTFNKTYVLLEGSAKHCEAKYIPRSFTLYSLAQKCLVKILLKKFQEKTMEPELQPKHHHMYYGLCHFSCLHDPFPIMKQPFLTLVKVFNGLGRDIFHYRLRNGGWTEAKLLTEIGKVLVLHSAKVKSDTKSLQVMFPSLPPPLVKDLVCGLIKFSLADLMLYAYGPDPDPEFVDVDAYRLHFLSDAGALHELPQAMWVPL